MRVQWYLITYLALVPCVAAAQPGTADGVRALVAADYVASAHILRPLAEGGPDADHLAQFFMAMLYQSGRGVAMNAVRACGLYLKAARPENPLMRQSLALAASIHQDSPFMRGRCIEAADGVWRDPPVTAFTLAVDHWVRIDQTGLTVGYKGAEKTPSIEWGGVEWVFLPVRLTQLDVSSPVLTRRYFIEFFMWVPPLQDQRAWTLMWVAYEVVGLETLPVPGDGPVATFTGAHPPTSLRLENVARIGRTPTGDAERIVLGQNSRSTVIPFGGTR